MVASFELLPETLINSVRGQTTFDTFSPNIITCTDCLAHILRITNHYQLIMSCWNYSVIFQDTGSEKLKSKTANLLDPLYYAVQRKCIPTPDNEILLCQSCLIRTLAGYFNRCCYGTITMSSGGNATENGIVDRYLPNILVTESVRLNFTLFFGGFVQ